ncbi:MAG: dicarboxylate/amino acid:cation symporter [Planctomycetota bacterium]
MSEGLFDEPDRPAGGLAPWRWPLHWQILLGLVIGALIGLWIGAWAVGGVDPGVAAEQRGVEAAKLATDSYAYLFFDLVGDLFIQGLKLIIVPLVMSSIILAVANLGSSHRGEGGGFGRLTAKTLAYYGTTSVISVLIGLAVVNTLAPGITTNSAGQAVGILEGQDLSAFATDQAAVDDKVGGKQGSDFLDVFREMVPPNIIDAAAQGKLLGLIVVSILIGYFLSKSNNEPAQLLRTIALGVYDLTLAVTELVLKLAPIGIIGLIAATLGEQYAKLVPDGRLQTFITGLTTFAGGALLALALHFLVVMPLILFFVARVNPIKHYRAMMPALLTAFSTASSSATLPVTMECVEERAKVSNKTTSFVLPLGATVNMDGTALYECVAAIFICQAFGVDLSFGQQFLIVVTAVLTSIGVAGVPSASLVAIVVILTAVQDALPPGSLPDGVLLVSGLGLLFVFDRPLDMCRTAVNVFSDSVGAVTIAKTEGETEVLQD